MTDEKSLDVIVQEKLDADTDFQASLEGMSDEDKTKAISTKTSELRDAEFKTLADAKVKAETIASDQRIRAEKAEKKPIIPDELSSKDILYLAKADIHEEDMDIVREWAKFKKLPVQKAHDEMKDMLAVRAEQRRTAEATATRGGSRGTTQVKPDEVLSRARTGEVPEDDAGIEALAEARFQERLKKGSG